jgi:hypothetical protein
MMQLQVNKQPAATTTTKPFVFIAVLKGKTILFGSLEWVKKTGSFQDKFFLALAAAHLAAEPDPHWEGGGKDGQMIGFL